MSHAIQAHPPEAPAPLRFSRAEFQRMAEAGLFEGRRVELLEGEVIETTPQGSRHTSERSVEVLGEPDRDRGRYRRQQRIAEDASLVLPNGRAVTASALLPPA